MEPVSIAASLLAVLEATVVVCKSTITLYRNVRHVPKELAILITRISQTQVRLDFQLRLCQGLNNGFLASWVPDQALITFQADLENAKACLDNVRHIIPAESDYSKNKCGFSWVVQNKRKVHRILGNLQNIDNNLSAMLDTMTLALSLRSNELLNKLHTDQSSPMAQLHYSHRTIGTPFILSPVVTQITPQRTTTRPNAHGREILWWFQLSWPSLRHSLAIKEILSRDSLFVKACQAGNVEEVRQLALSGKGMPSSVDEAGRPMLHYAIRSGSLELVEFLLHNGATPDDLETQCQVSPLQEACRYGHSDIARLLLAKGAFLEHADHGGRTAFTMLWFQLSTQFSRADFLKLLLAYSPMSSIFDPTAPIGPFACAAMKGKVEDLELLSRTGTGWNSHDRCESSIVKYSIFGSNLATYEYLLRRLPRDWIHDVDQMGRGPLHIVLQWCGYNVEEIVKSLIDAGADVHLTDLNGNNPGDVARICDARAVDDGLSSGNVQKFFRALKSRGFDIELDQDNVLWWPSQDRS
ncbi:MAG: hypothetical protein Q9192_007551, partial [Flavoplaca navasiana]